MSDGSLSFAIFLYGEIQWTAGEAKSGGVIRHGGTPALVGVNAGDEVRQFSVSESLRGDIININTTSNIGVPGVWIFQVNGEQTSVNGKIKVYGIVFSCFNQIKPDCM